MQMSFCAPPLFRKQTILYMCFLYRNNITAEFLSGKMSIIPSSRVVAE